MRVKLFRARQRRFDGTAATVVLPGEDGEVTVLDFHAPMLCTLSKGDVIVDEAAFPVQGGLARVARNVVTIIAR